MSRKGKKEQEVTIQQEVTELLSDEPEPKIDPEALCEDLIGHPVKCGKCRADLLVIGEIRVVRGRVPQQFYPSLYRIICAECAEIVEEAINIAETKGEIVGYERALNGALYFFRKVVDDGLKDDGCAVCGKLDPMDKPDKFRHRVIIGLPAEIWHGEPEMRQLKGCELCELHARSAHLASFRTVPVQKHLDRRVEKEDKLSALAEKFNSRRTNVVPINRKTGTTDK